MDRSKLLQQRLQFLDRIVDDVSSSLLAFREDDLLPKRFDSQERVSSDEAVTTDPFAISAAEWARPPTAWTTPALVFVRARGTSACW